jgi:hypothetical protein
VWTVAIEVESFSNIPIQYQLSVRSGPVITTVTFKETITKFLSIYTNKNVA